MGTSGNEIGNRKGNECEKRMGTGVRGEWKWEQEWE